MRGFKTFLLCEVDGGDGGVCGGVAVVVAVESRAEDRTDEREAREGAPAAAGGRGRVDNAVGGGEEPRHVLAGPGGRGRWGEVPGKEDGSRGIGGVARARLGLHERGR